MSPRDQTQELLASIIGDKYEVLQWIGGGGMAEVFLARHRVHGGLAAVKVLAEQLAREPVVVERFLQEARTAAALSGHANVVTIFDVGEAQGLYYLIMQYIEGEDLGTCLERRGRLEPGEAAEILKQVTSALAWAHAKGVVHRDLKPSNIRLDQNGRPIVLDFGIAKASSVPTALTTMGERLGTPLYMAPEQIRGEACDGRTDLYALGLVFYELLTGERPFGGSTYYEIEHAQVNTPAPSPAESAPGIPESYCQVVLRLLEKDPAARYQTAEELIEDLRLLEAGTPERVGPPVTPAPRPAPPVRPVRHETGWSRKTWLVFGGGAAAIAAVIAIAVIAGGKKPAAQEATPPVEKKKTAELPARIDTPTGAMVLVPRGPFTFGDSAKESPNPARTVTLPDFYVDVTEVTNAAYRQFADATGRPMPQPAGPPENPVAGVTLIEARAFAAWAGKRLPTEEEWEKAARGTDGRKYPWGDTPPQAGLANLSGGGSLAADSNPGGASPYGVKNMAGNVWEWTVSAYPVTQQEVADMARNLPGTGSTWNVIKGGGFFAPPGGELWARTYMRRGFPVEQKAPFLGFRCVRDAN